MTKLDTIGTVIYGDRADTWLLSMLFGSVQIVWDHLDRVNR